MKKLDKITLICCDTVNYGQAILSLKKSLSQISPARTIFFTDIDLPKQEGVEIIKIAPIKSKQEYSRWILKELWKYIETEFVLVTQWDGHVLNGDSWDDEFYNYDYIGAPWIYEHGRNIANGGFSLRSYRLCSIMATDPLIQVMHPEDQSIGILYRGHLEQNYGIKFPDEDLADHFSFELKSPAYDTFGFHGFFHNPYQKTVVIKRTGALGDVVACEPVLEYFHKNKYKVVLDTLPQFFNLFINHYFKVHHPQEIDQRLLKDARFINLDMAYEITPARLHLKSYYETCGIQDGEIRNPKLSLPFDHKNPQAKLFKKYVVLHLDKRAQEARNVYGVDWYRVVGRLKVMGYEVINIGNGEHIEITGAVDMVNMNEVMLMRLLGGADFMIAVDSGPANIAVSMGTKCIIFFGSVEPAYIYPDLSNIEVIQYENVCRSPKCWHSVIGCEGIECVETNGKKQYKVQPMQGTECVETDDIPPCVNFTTQQVYDAIKKITNE